jgi:hypothetical protein
MDRPCGSLTRGTTRRSASTRNPWSLREWPRMNAARTSMIVGWSGVNRGRCAPAHRCRRSARRALCRSRAFDRLRVTVGHLPLLCEFDSTKCQGSGLVCVPDVGPEPSYANDDLCHRRRSRRPSRRDPCRVRAFPSVGSTTTHSSAWARMTATSSRVRQSVWC